MNYGLFGRVILMSTSSWRTVQTFNRGDSVLITK